MHRPLRTGLAVVVPTAAAMSVCGIGQASAARLEPNDHGSTGMTVTAGDAARQYATDGADIDIDVDLGRCLDLGLDLGSILGAAGLVGTGSAHHAR